MKTFKLPDLGEGLPDAIIREWYVKVGDEVSTDQPLVAMETAKALVDVPAPFHGKVEKLFGEEGDTIETGDPLIGFEGEVISATTETNTQSTTAVTVKTNTASRIQASPAVRALAKKHGVDLNTLAASGERISAEDVERAAKGKTKKASSSAQALSPARRAMVLSMKNSQQNIVPVTISDDADIHAWEGKQDVTLRIIRAISKACEAEPILNSTFDAEELTYQANTEVNIGIAVDTPHGLYVPVLKNANTTDTTKLREKINQFKEQAKTKSITQEDLHGGTIMFSNFGTVAGRYANPIIVPPMVTIVGVGKVRDEVTAYEGKIVIHRIMPLSITIDHRLVTGGEAARFLHAMMNDLALSN